VWPVCRPRSLNALYFKNLKFRFDIPIGKTWSEVRPICALIEDLTVGRRRTELDAFGKAGVEA
jgi:hypothetical protein